MKSNSKTLLDDSHYFSLLFMKALVNNRANYHQISHKNLKLTCFICAYASCILLSANMQVIAFYCPWKVNLEMQFLHDSICAGNDCVHSGERNVSYLRQQHNSAFEYHKSVCKTKYQVK